MTDFFTNLIDRHLGIGDIIQPRIPGRFEMDSAQLAAASPDEGINPVESESEQTLRPSQPSRDVFYPGQKKTASDINFQESMVNNGHHSGEPRSTFVVDTPTITPDESDVTINKDFSTSSFQKENNVSIQSGLPEQQAIFPAPGKSNDTQGLNIDRYSRPVSQQQQHTQADKTNLVDDKQKTFNDKHVPINRNDSYGVMRDHPSPPTSLAGEQHPENELNHRIHAMLQRLMDAPAPSMTEPAPGDQSHNESPIPAVSEEKASLLDVAATLTAIPGEATPNVNRQTPREEKKHSSDNDNLRRNSQLDAPAWLPEIEARLSQLQPAEIKTEPVINVTIGRVEVRAVQSEIPQPVKRQKKPVGVMSLDDYLRQRKHGKQT
ncbi:MAG: hypothetical protein GXP08_11925 [Gammaproteobacteria bacterium]|nr:hypothetical protein [Gammaproteobacteria bacterium]